MPKASIIIPVYNTGQYLEACLKSIAMQDYCDFEAILIDDGSTDNSGEICNRFSDSDNRFRSFHVENHGVSAARNFGLDNANGDYIIFVDSDDEVSVKYLSTLMSVNDSDLVVANSSSAKHDLDKNSDSVRKPMSYNINEQGISLLVDQHLINAIYAKRFRRRIIDNKQIRFHEDISLGEDTLFVAEYIINCNSFDYIDSTVYYYRYDNVRPTLSRYDNNYIEKLELANNRVAKALETVIPCFSQSLSWKKRVWNVYYQALFQVLNTEASDRQKKAMIDDVFHNDRFLELVHDVDRFMAGDGRGLRRLVKKRRSTGLMVYWRLRQFLKRV